MTPMSTAVIMQGMRMDIAQRIDDLAEARIGLLGHFMKELEHLRTGSIEVRPRDYLPSLCRISQS
jgi:hypothetical protein